ncbi:hypothetical protein SASPL_114600 [Salvia splendens]|uniref:ENTH domain-containing protein n=1 Tax=Salvia splendens TaxID=180675 RepID=A0A8X8ZZH9_SALSN|nr:hypothetical protein SASPL_114600 [Salvia splendens]
MSRGGTQSSIRKTLGALKDSTTVSLAKINSDYKELDIAIVKATNHVERPAKERHIKAVFAAVSATRPRADVAYCIHALARRLAKTHNWAVALKTLIVIHRALREVDPTFQDEIINYGRSRGHMLNLAHFKDDSSPNAWDYSAWVRCYALFLEERMECYRRTKDLDTPDLLEHLPALQQLLHRVIGCQVASESIKIYSAISDGIVNLVDKFFEMQRHDALKALDIYRRAGNQAERLSEFYEICKNLDVGSGERFIKIEQGDDKPKAILAIEYKTSSEVKDEHLQSPPPAEPEPEPEPVKVEAPASEPPPDLLGLNEPAPAATELDERNSLALAIVTTEQPASTGPNLSNGVSGWELALVTAPSSNDTAAATSKLAGGLDMLTLDSLYDDAIRQNNQSRQAASYNPWEQGTMGNSKMAHDPFYASNEVAAPTNVQMSNQPNPFMFQPQQQMMMMGPHQPLNPYMTGVQPHPYGTGMPAQAYNPYSGLI